MKVNRVVAAVVGLVVLLALCAGAAFVVTSNVNAHNLAVQRAANRPIPANDLPEIRTARPSALASALASARAAQRRARQAARRARPAPAPVVVVPPAQPVPVGAPQPNANAEAVVDQFYQDITNGDYTDAWNLGGDNVSGGVGYNAWVAGYATTTSVTLDTQSQWNSTTVQADITATQVGGTENTYSGIYTVQGGVITSADITQTS